jgi:hypothetical protein
MIGEGGADREKEKYRKIKKGNKRRRSRQGGRMIGRGVERIEGE